MNIPSALCLGPFHPVRLSPSFEKSQKGSRLSASPQMLLSEVVKYSHLLGVRIKEIQSPLVAWAGMPDLKIQSVCTQ